MFLSLLNTYCMQLSVHELPLTDCPVGTWGIGCSNQCDCDEDGGDDCVKDRGCICKPGYKGTKCDTNIDECALNLDNCQSDQTCVDSFGSFSCACFQGYQLDANNICIGSR